MAGDGVLYMMTGDKHANVLVASVFSLRKNYRGPIAIAVGDDRAEKIANLVAADVRLSTSSLGTSSSTSTQSSQSSPSTSSISSQSSTFDPGPITVKRWQPPSGQRGDGYRQKTFMIDLTPFDRTVFLDADTIVRGSIDNLFNLHPHLVALTQFSDWVSNGRRISGRIASWTDVAPGDVAEMHRMAYPAINTGVIAFAREATAFFDEWKSLTARKPVFINDELAAQLIFHRHLVKVLDSRWNYSPIHDHKHGDDWVILHAHGKKHVRRDCVRELWLPWYEQCVLLNIAGIADWTPAGDKHLRAYLEKASDPLDFDSSGED